MAAPIIGISHIDLSVRDRAASARWYVDVLGFEIRQEGRNERHDFAFTVIVHPRAGLSLALCEHPQNPGEPFDEHRCGLDHLSFELPAGTDLEAWGPVGEDNGVPLVVLRDPDNIQIELYAGKLEELAAESP